MATKNVQVIKNQTNSKELFKKWNEQNKSIIECSISKCYNSTEDAYIVQELVNSNKFITPLCQECYKEKTDYTNQSSSTFTDFGLVEFIEENLLVRFTS
jgi:hypothetical protein